MNRKKREIATMMPKMKAESRIYEVQLDLPLRERTQSWAMGERLLVCSVESNSLQPHEQ